MFRESNRNTKNRSMMLSLYVLSFFSVVSLLLFFLSAIFNILKHWRFETLFRVFEIVQDSFFIVFGGLLLSLPFAASLTYLVVAHLNTRWAPFLFTLMKLSSHTPYILFGLVFLVIFGGSHWSLMVVVCFLSLSQLSRRWIELSTQVKPVEVEAMQALGMLALPIIYHLYIRRFFKNYLYHVLAVFCFLFMLLTPFLCFVFFEENSITLLSTELYRNLGIDRQLTSGLMLLLLIIHSMRFFLDQLTSFWEVEYS